MRIVVTGATGNLGTSLLGVLAADPRVSSIVGIARRVPSDSSGTAEWAAADVGCDPLVPLFARADAVVHLAWRIQPSRRPAELWATNVLGSSRVVDAVGAARVPTFVYASSVGAYSAGPKDRRVTEDWPVGGVPSSGYSVHKAAVEHRLFEFERRHPGTRVVRMRPGLVFARGAAVAIRRLFGGPLVPTPLVKPSRLRLVPDVPGLRVQAVHSHDVARAFAAALFSDARGAFNVAAEPPLDPPTVARVLGARLVRVPVPVARSAFDVTYRLRLHPAEPGWLRLALGAPIMDVSRAADELGWRPRVDATTALLELLDGMAEGASTDTPALSAATSGVARSREIAGRMGAREVR